MALMAAKSRLMHRSKELSLFEARSCADDRRWEQIAEMSSFPPIVIIGRLRSQINESLRLQLSDTHHAAFVGNDEAWQQIFER